MASTASFPQFHHPEIENLYRYGFNLPPDIIEAIVNLPRATVIADLEAVLRDAMQRFDTFYEKDWDNNTHTFPIHAMMLLGGLRAEESLPLLLETHRQKSEWLDFWFSDWFLEDLWEPLMWCGVNRLDDLVAFFLEQDTEDMFAPGNAVVAMTQLVVYYPERRSEVVQKLEEMLRFFLNQDYNEGVTESLEMKVANLAGAVDDLQEDSLLPLVEQCFERNIIDLMMFGDWKDYIEFYRSGRRHEYLIFPRVADWYAHEWKEQQRREAYDDKLEETRMLQSPSFPGRPIPPGYIQTTHGVIVNKNPKIGRNDPCPCGSGKKYKRCCGNQDN